MGHTAKRRNFNPTRDGNVNRHQTSTHISDTTEKTNIVEPLTKSARKLGTPTDVPYRNTERLTTPLYLIQNLNCSGSPCLRAWTTATGRSHGCLFLDGLNDHLQGR